MKRITYNGVTYTCTLSERFRRHTPEELAAIRETARAVGICTAIRVYHDTTLGLSNCIMDGEGRLISAVQLNLPPERVPFYHEGKRATEEAYERAQILNDARRHDDPEAVRKRRAERAKIAAELHAKGQSTRAIAKQVGADQSTIVRDLSRGDAPASPDHKSEGENEKAADLETGSTLVPPKVIGIDGKKYPARKRRPNWMKPGYKGDPNHHFAKALAAMSTATGAVTAALNGPFGAELKAALTFASSANMKTVMVEHRDVIEDGKKSGPRFVGFRPVRTLVRKVGLSSKLLTCKQVLEILEKANDPEAQDLE